MVGTRGLPTSKNRRSQHGYTRSRRQVDPPGAPGRRTANSGLDWRSTLFLSFWLLVAAFGPLHGAAAGGTKPGRARWAWARFPLPARFSAVFRARAWRQAQTGVASPATPESGGRNERPGLQISADGLDRRRRALVLNPWTQLACEDFMAVPTA